MTDSVLPFLMIQRKKVEEAIEFYVDLIPDSHVENILRYGTITLTSLRRSHRLWSANRKKRSKPLAQHLKLKERC